MDFNEGFQQKRYAREKQISTKVEADAADWDSLVPGLVRSGLGLSWFIFITAFFAQHPLYVWYGTLASCIVVGLGSLLIILARFDRLDIIQRLLTVFALMLCCKAELWALPLVWPEAPYFMAGALPVIASVLNLIIEIKSPRPPPQLSY